MVFFFINWCLLVATLGLSSALSQHFGIGFYLQTSSVNESIKLFCAAALISLLNATLGRILKLMFLPISCLTFGLSSLFINALILEIVNYLKLGIRLENFVAALVGATFIAIIHPSLKKTVKLILR